MTRLYVGLQVRNPCMHPFYIITNIQHYPCEYVKYKREAHGQEGGINKKQPDLSDRDIEFFTKVGAYAK